METKAKIIETLGDECTGCGACAAGCPTSCITLKNNARGFLYPVCDQNRCIGCGVCDKVCPRLHPVACDCASSTMWGQALDEHILRSSSSGGVFSLLAHIILNEDGGIVIGAAFDESSHRVRHVAVDNVDDLQKLKVSKYVQSRVSPEIFWCVRDALIEGRKVLFSGTACQVAGLKSFLGARADSNDLLCVEVVCHGVPSPLLWDIWLSSLEESKGQKVAAVNFRDKKTGWSSYSVTYRFKDGSAFSRLASEDWYMRAFLNNASLRPSCFSCSAKMHSGADIVLGDYWGMRASGAKRPERLGVSCVIINTSLGEQAVGRTLDRVCSGESSFELVSQSNAALVSPARPFSEYEAFMECLETASDCTGLMAKFPFKRPLYRRILSRVAALLRSGG